MVLFAVKLQTTVEVFVSDSVLQNMYNNIYYYSYSYYYSYYYLLLLVLLLLKNQKTCNVFSAYLLHEAACHDVLSFTRCSPSSGQLKQSPHPYL